MDIVKLNGKEEVKTNMAAELLPKFLLMAVAIGGFWGIVKRIINKI